MKHLENTRIWKILALVERALDEEKAIYISEAAETVEEVLRQVDTSVEIEARKGGCVVTPW